MFTRLLTPPNKKSFFLFGPRGTGKTTWVKSTFPQALYLDLLESELFNDLLANPQRLENLIPKGFKDWIILDEVQRVPDLLSEVHRLIEKHGHKFILTGSSARKLKAQKGPNLLAGRALTYSLHPLTSSELGSDFRLEHSLKVGCLPCVYTEKDPKAYLESYVKTYLEQEIQQEGLTRKLSAFSRFLEAASFSQGSLLNISTVARECAIERKVVENYFTILEDLLIAHRVSPFVKRRSRRVAAHPKFYFFDVGVYRTLRPSGPLDMPEMIEGVALESLLYQELTALNAYLKSGYSIHYWRTSAGSEVDLVLYGPKGLLAFEVKRSSRVSSSDLRGLKLFHKDYPMARLYFAYGGTRVMREGPIEIIPMVKLLEKLHVILS